MSRARGFELTFETEEQPWVTCGSPSSSRSSTRSATCPELLASLAAQVRRADVVALVDDGSTDALARARARRSPRRIPARSCCSARRASRGATGSRAARPCAPSPGAVEQLDDGWDVVAKVDADLRLNPRLLATLEREFLADPEPRHGGHVPLRARRRRRHGAPALPARARRGRDEVLPARRAGSRSRRCPRCSAGTRSTRFARACAAGGPRASRCPAATRCTCARWAATTALLRGFRRWGTCAWVYGEHPLHVLAVGAQRLGDRPRVLGGASYVLGWALAALRRMPRAEREVRREVSRDGLRRLGVRALPRLATSRVAGGRP